MCVWEEGAELKWDAQARRPKEEMGVSPGGRGGGRVGGFGGKGREDGGLEGEPGNRRAPV